MKIATGTPYWGAYDKEHFQCVMDMGYDHPEITIGTVQDCPYIDQAKSIIATRYLDTHDVVVIIDHDMIFTAESVVQLAMAAVEENAIVGAAYGARMRGAKRPIAFCELPVTFFQGGGLVAAATVAGGFMAMPTKVLKDIVLHFDMRKVQTSLDFMAYPLMHSMLEGDKWWGEDISFCKRAQAAGFRTLLDTRIRVGHKGAYVYQIEDGLVSVPRLDSVLIEEKKDE